jgi:multidrug efflux pump subunit AcrA (membrane-fusion protein)
MGFIIEVDNPYKNVQPGVRPPLVKGMFVEVELKGNPSSGNLVIPRSSVHNQHAYVVNDQKRLERRLVTTELSGSSYVVVKEGLIAGEKVVVSDLSPAIDGMLLEPVIDTDMSERIINDAKANAKGVIK